MAGSNTVILYNGNGLPTNYITVGSTATATATGSGIGLGLDVSAYAGADLGAKIAAADAALGATPGALYIKDGTYSWTTHVTTKLNPNRIIRFGAVTVTCTGSDPSVSPFVYPGPMLAVGDNTVVEGIGDGTVFDEPDSSVVFALQDGTTNVTFRNFTVQNIANSAPLGQGTSLPNIGIGNGTNVRVQNVTFKNTRSLAVSAGSDSSTGKHADSFEISGCIFDGVKCITAAVVNGKNFRIHHNHWRNVGAVGPAAPYSSIVCLDIEPNVSTDNAENFVIGDNTFDLTNAGTSATAILVQGAGVGRRGVVSNNTISCGTSAGTGPSCGIGINGQKDITVIGNNIDGQFSQIPLSIIGGSDITLCNNRIRSTGSTSYKAILVQSASVRARVYDNTIVVENTDAGWAAIGETSDCSAGLYYGNNLFGGNTTPYPKIQIDSSSSRAYLNYLNGALLPGDGAAGIFDTAAICAASPTAVSAGNLTTGQKIYTTYNGTLIGVRFYWNNASAATINVIVYATGGTTLASVAVAVNGAGSYTGLFTTPLALTAFTQVWVTMRESTGTNYQTGIDATKCPSMIFYGGGNVVFVDNANATGAVVPSVSTAATVRYPLTPLITF